MNVTLTPEVEELVISKLANGMYHSPSHVIMEGLRLLKEHDLSHDLRRENLRRQIASGFDSIDRGEFADCDRASVGSIAEHVKTRGRVRAQDVCQCAS